MKPGRGHDPLTGGDAPHRRHAADAREFIMHIVPESFFEAAATATCCRSSCSACSSGSALGMVGEEEGPMLDFCEALAETMFKFTGIVMRYAPIGVGAAIAYTVGHSGLGVLREPGASDPDASTLALAVFVLVVLSRSCSVQDPDGAVLPGGQGAGADRILDDVDEAALPQGAWKSSKRSACPGGSSRSSCRPGTASTWTAPRSTCRWPRCSSPRPPA